MATKRKNFPQESTEQRRKQEAEAARQAAGRSMQPTDVLNKSIMKREGKKMHQQDGK